MTPNCPPRLARLQYIRRKFMAKKVLLGGILGGIVLFFWGFVWHEVLPFGLIGIKDIPNENTMISAMKTNVPEAGMYMIPGLQIPANATSAKRKAAEEAAMKKASTGPAGLLIYHPVGKGMDAGMLMTECGTNILQALLVAFLLAQTGLQRFGSRLGFAFVIGVLAAITTNISYWNWYGFPAAYTLNAITFLVLGYFLVGLIAAFFVKVGAPQPLAKAAAA